jgi:pyruvate/2-oxoglutarate dehydrogenase complex dihydrolipoamide acyltransferase (E2) component
MLLSMSLPPINVHMTVATIMRVHARAGAALAPGAKLIDVRVDLSDAFAQDCPPVSYYRLVLRESAWLRRIAVAAGAEVAAGGILALLSTDAAEPLDGTASRAVRLATAGILWQPEWAAAAP